MIERVAGETRHVALLLANLGLVAHEQSDAALALAQRSPASERS